MSSEKPSASRSFGLGRMFGRSRPEHGQDGEKSKTPTWSMGVLNDPKTVEVPGSVLLLASHRNEPLGLRNVHARTSHSSIPTGFPVDVPLTPGGSRPAHPPQAHSPGGSGHQPSTLAPMDSSRSSTPAHQPEQQKKKTEDGRIILDPQPDDSANDPLNWPNWKRDAALLSLGIYCMIGGGITPLIAAGFTDVAEDYDIHVEKVALTTGLYMMGLGVGSVLFSPTAILWGKRPVYLFSSIVFIATSLWAGFSPSFESLLAARVFQGIAVSPVECLPSATIAEIYFLHERAYRIGIYTLLLLGGKNLVPLVSAAVIGRWGWRWTFWIVAIIVAFCGVLLFLFVPETFWDRTPTRKPHKRPSFLRRLSSRTQAHHGDVTPVMPGTLPAPEEDADRPASPGAAARAKDLHVGFAGDVAEDGADENTTAQKSVAEPQTPTAPEPVHESRNNVGFSTDTETPKLHDEDRSRNDGGHEPVSATPRSDRQPSLADHGLPSPTYPDNASVSNSDYFTRGPNLDNERLPASELRAAPKIKAYTHNLRQQPAQSFAQQLKPFHGRLNNDKWLKVMVRPFILFAYPAVLWSSIVYATSVGWLIVISETIAVIYRDPSSYNFTAMQTGLVYISPFVGGILGTGVAGKISDVIVRAMSRRNGGLYEPEFRLVMAAPILVTTCMGLIGFGWSAQREDHWAIPTVFFGIVSFGCSLGSTTSITFCVDSYRQYAGEALVTLNFTKNICHGLVFSLFVTHWLADDGARQVYMWIGIIQLILLLLTIPMYIYGKRARMWTVRMNLMEKF